MISPVVSHATGSVEAIELDLGNEWYPDLRRVLAYWEQKRGDRFAPRRCDIDPVDLVEALPRIMLADVQRDPFDFRYRLSGTAILNVHGKEMTARGPRDLDPPHYGALIYDHYCECVRRRSPILHLIVLDRLERSRGYARLLMPLSEDGAEVTMLFAVDSKTQNTRALRDFFEEAAHQR
jgi:hypothetical protein